MLLTLGLKALGIGKTLLSWVRDCIEWIFKDWRYVLIAVLSLIAAYWYIDSGKARKQADKATAALVVANKTIADMKDASEAARLAQIALNDKRKQDERTTANETDSKDRVAQVEANQLGIVYRDRWRVRDVCKGIAASPDSTAKNPVAESSNGASDIANMVAITESDHGICTANSIRLQSVKQWGDELIAKGLAEPAKSASE